MNELQNIYITPIMSKRGWEEHRPKRRKRRRGFWLLFLNNLQANSWTNMAQTKGLIKMIDREQGVLFIFENIKAFKIIALMEQVLTLICQSLDHWPKPSKLSCLDI